MMADLDEQRLIEDAQRDPACFADLYERHFERVYAFVVRRVRDRHSAEDLTSEVFHRALANLRTFECRDAGFQGWILRIAANAIADRWERLARERGQPLKFEPGEIPADELFAAEQSARLFRHVR